MSYTHVKLTETNLVDLIPIFKNSFGIKPTYNRLLKIYDTSFSGVVNLGVITYYKKNIPVSFFGVFPLFIKYDGNKILFSQSGNTMTHMDHTGRGLIYEAGIKTFEFCINENIKGIFGFPSKSSFSTFKKGFGWKFKDNILNYSFRIFTFPLGAASKKILFLRGIYNSWIKFILLFYKKGFIFESSIEIANQNGVFRDVNFWKYKLQNDDLKLIKISGIDVVIKFNGSLLVGDINFKSDFNFRLFLLKLKFLAFISLSSFVKFYVSEGTLLDNNLREFRTPKIGLPIGIYSFDKFNSFDNLKFTLFDFDTF